MKSVVKIPFWLLIIFIFNVGCVHSQEKQAAKPNVKINVHKQYDDKGNVIGYDSTYRYSYSDSSKPFTNDTIFNNIPGFHNFSFHSFNGVPNNLDSIFNGNLLNANPFFNDPFFNQNLGNNMNPFEQMQKMLRNIDSLRGNPFIIPAPQPIPKKNKQSNPKPLQNDTIKDKIDEI